VAVTETERPNRLPDRTSADSARPRARLRGALAQLRAWRDDGSDRSIAQRTAGTAFLIRVASAAVLYASQVLLARWMGRFEFGIYVYVWAWVGFLGMLAGGGVAASAQRFVPEYKTLADNERLRGFLLGGRWLSFGYGTLMAALVVVAVVIGGSRIPPHYWLPFLIGAAVIPIFPVSSIQDTISRCFHWIELGLIPNYIVHPLLIIAALLVFHAFGEAVTAVHALVVAGIGFWLITLMQTALLSRRLDRAAGSGRRRYEYGYWIAVALPIALVDGFFLMLTYVDILILQAFVGPSEVAVYHAATKTLALVNFIYFAVSAASAHRFAQYHVTGEKKKLVEFLHGAVRWTFWPSLAFGLALLALGKPILGLFGPGFDEGYPLMFVLVIGLLARASVGPAERLLSMQGQQSICAAIYGTTFFTNLILCVTLIPRLGLIGAAAATASAIVVESILLFVVAKRRLGLHAFVFTRPSA
jgi:O-antigen/teichoic acid export membrane protein